MWRLAAVTAGTLISAPFILASIRAFFFFGKLAAAVETMQTGLLQAKRELEVFIADSRSYQEHVDELISMHDTRLTVIETERKTEQRFGRRVTDKQEGEART